MASGQAIAGRWGRPPEELTGALRDKAMALEAAYLAAGLRSIVFSFAPQRIVIGGGVGLTPGLIPRVRNALVAALGGYPGLDQYERPGFVVAAKLGGMAPEGPWPWPGPSGLMRAVKGKRGGLPVFACLITSFPKCERERTRQHFPETCRAIRRLFGSFRY